MSVIMFLYSYRTSGLNLFPERFLFTDSYLSPVKQVRQDQILEAEFQK